ncbi:hypothetical protein L2744_21090 [Shewanella profunda]|uniref:hypothetical protein n=1 Tax=Shewanella profunda TaxID=254793 RepID=UPI00200D54B9|nr:hypothetical protein [Shewanella profunda]MCL1092047.1 hypothetical protein [Shewanella profunda]
MTGRPNFLARLRERRQERENNQGERAAKRRLRWARWAAFYAATLSTALTTYTAYKEFRPKRHELDIFVSDLQVNGDIAEYGVAFYNKGDFHEVVASASSILGQFIEEYSAPLNWEQDQCFSPVVVKPGDATYVRYTTKFDFGSLKHRVFKTQKQQYLMMVDFDVLSQENGIISVRVPVGTLVPYESEWKGKAGYDFLTQKVSVDFDLARPRLTKGTYPQDEEFSFSKLCKQKEI